jgi:6-phosphogluconolactonase
MAQNALLFVGSINRATGYFATAEGEGISVFTFDEENGQATLQSVFKGIDNPTFIAVDRLQHLLFATSEVYGWNEGMVTALRFDAGSGALSYLNKQATLGSIAAHAGTDHSGRYVLVTNYAHESKWAGFYGEDVPGQATAVFPIDERGWLGAAISSVAHKGSSENPARQNEPHPHCAIVSPDNRFVLIADLGIDAVVIYGFAEGRLTRTSAFSLPPGSGPRHLKFAPNGRSVYVISELASTVAHLAYNAQTGELTQQQVVSTLPAGFSSENHCSELQISGDGAFLYGANRGHDSLAIFHIDPDDGSLEAIGHVPCGGVTPRNFGLSPSGSHLLVANQNSRAVAIFRRDASNGMLEQSGALDVGSPMVVAMVPAEG